MTVTRMLNFFNSEKPLIKSVVDKGKILIAGGFALSNFIPNVFGYKLVSPVTMLFEVGGNVYSVVFDNNWIRMSRALNFISSSINFCANQTVSYETVASLPENLTLDSSMGFYDRCTDMSESAPASDNSDYGCPTQVVIEFFVENLNDMRFVECMRTNLTENAAQFMNIAGRTEFWTVAGLAVGGILCFAATPFIYEYKKDIAKKFNGIINFFTRRNEAPDERTLLITAPEVDQPAANATTINSSI